LEIALPHHSTPQECSFHFWRKARCMSQLSGVRFVLSAAILAIGFTTAGRAKDMDKAPAFSEQALQAKIQYCNDCHQPLGQGYLGASPIPRLAGQQPGYFTDQLKAFVDRGRVSFYMFKVAHSLNPAMLSALATHFKDLDPKPLGGAPKQFVSAGKKIFEEGVPADKVPPCSTCHGKEAKGNGPIPRLAGQLYPYTISTLTNWDKERAHGKAASPESAVMGPIAHRLTESQIRAVAAYLSYLE